MPNTICQFPPLFQLVRQYSAKSKNSITITTVRHFFIAWIF